VPLKALCLFLYPQFSLILAFTVKPSLSQLIFSIWVNKDSSPGTPPLHLEQEDEENSKRSFRDLDNRKTKINKPRQTHTKTNSTFFIINPLQSVDYRRFRINANSAKFTHRNRICNQEHFSVEIRI
jgi:hypothetical protein